jgi:hypothetical protein
MDGGDCRMNEVRVVGEGGHDVREAHLGGVFGT